MQQATTYDAIVIGSGIGGLTAAGLLAAVGGKKVLVLEKHTEPGGLTHVFRRDGAQWDVGVHYIGNMAPGSQARTLFDYLSGAELTWSRMPDAFDRYIYPGLHFAVPSDPAQYEKGLIDTFPEEAKAIHRYFKDIRKAMRWAMLGFMRGMAPPALEPLLRTVQRLTAGHATQTTQSYLEKHFRSPKLRALLVSLWGDYGLPPSRSAFAMHAIVVHHYLQGAWFPVGGASRIARTFEKGIEHRGGSIRVAQEVTDILVEQGRAVGVRLMDRRGHQSVERTVRAPLVISNIGARGTYGRLLSTQGEVGAATAAVRAQIQKMGNGLSAVTLYLRLKADARTLGVQGENFWINTDIDHDDIAGQTADLMQGQPRSVFVSFPSIKSGDTRFHTAELIAHLDPGAFSAFAGRPKSDRGADYGLLKSRIGDGLLRLAETAIPGISNLVAYAELSTPMTVEHFTSHPQGAFYGLPGTPERFRSTLLGPRTPIEGLYLSGQDAGSLGIVGAMMGGVGAASQVLGAKGYWMIQTALRGPHLAHNSATKGSRTLPPEKRVAVLQAKHRLTPSIWDVCFKIEGDLADYAPGQFARLHVGQGEWRDYSIAGWHADTVRFLISTRTGGHGSHFVEKAAIGDPTEIELPLGEYTLVDTNHRKVFLATGTGMAPFLPMFRELERRGALHSAVLIFGCRTLADDITRNLTPLPPQVIRCVSREPAPPGDVHGRVSAALDNFTFDPDATDFYLCGASSMVADIRKLLSERGAKHLFTESY